MKKYGDDADSFYDQGTRVEASKRWHKQNQLRHDYNYRSSPRTPNRSYNKSNKSSYKPDYSKTYNQSKTNQQHRRKQSNSSSYKPSKPYTHYGGPRPKVSCLPKYYGSNYKSKSKNYQQNKSRNTTSKTDDNWITWIIALALIVIFVIPLMFNPFSFFHDIGESTGTGPIPFFAFILIVIVSCILLGYYGTKN